MGYLGVTFRGPFAFCIRNRSIDVYAAICDNHHAAVFTLLSEHPLCGRHRRGGEYTYMLDGEGIKNNTSEPIEYHDDENKSVILDADPGSDVDVCQANFCISVPRPLDAYPISPANTEVVRANPTGHLRNYATGLRLIYECDLSKSVVLKAPCLHKDHGPDLDLDFGDPPELTNYADIEFRYVGPDADDSDHLDAISCFDNTMKMFGLPWWLNYDSYGTISVRTRTGSDCRSAVIMAGRI
jgi:hypothetical protein